MRQSNDITRQNKAYKVLIVGQTPPPYGGQAIMIENILKASYTKLHLFHVRMAFSANMSQMRKVSLSKILHLPLVILKILWMRLRYGITLLYYPPAGPNRAPMYRDFAILICTRWMFPKTIFHFHAGGITELYPGLSAVERILFRLAYFHPDASIMLAKTNPPDGTALQSKNNYIIPYGIEDHFSEFTHSCSMHKPPLILFVGVICRSKGVCVLLDSLIKLKKENIGFKARFVGEFESEQFQTEVMSLVNTGGIKDMVEFPGVLTGKSKWMAYAEANIFCYPTFFESETFGLVVLEAMQFEVPVLVSDWRGVPMLVEENETGFIVPTKNSKALADKLKILIKDPQKAREMGKKARQRYLEQYSSSIFTAAIENALVSVCTTK